MVRPHRFWSIEYGLALVTVIGMSKRSAYSIDSLAGEAPAPHRREHLEVGRERARRHLEAHLVVALAGAAVGDGVGAVLAGGRDQVLGDERPGERRHQRVLALVDGVGLERGRHEVARRTPRGSRRRRPRPRRRRGPARGSRRSRRPGPRRRPGRSPRRPAPRSSSAPPPTCRARRCTPARPASCQSLVLRSEPGQGAQSRRATFAPPDPLATPRPSGCRRPPPCRARRRARPGRWR